VPSWKKIIVSGSNAELNQLTATSYGGNISGSATSTGSFAKLRLSDSIELNTSASTDAIIHSGGENQGGTGNNLLLYTGEKKQHYTSLIDIEPGYSGNIVLNPHNDKLKVHGRLEFHESYAITTAGTNDLNITTREGSTPWAGYGDSSQIIVESDTNAGIKLYTHGTGTVYISGSSAGDKLEVVGGIKATGNISGSATSTGSFGHLELANRDTDASFEFGRAHVGFIGYSDMAGFSHVDHDSITNFSLAQSAAGKTIVQAASGQVIAFKIGGTDKVQISSAGNLGVGIETATEKLHVVGNVFATGNISGSATSTGSFGKLLGDGSSLTGIDTDLSGDTTPQLGGNLDLNSNNITGTGNIDILGTITAQNFIVSSSVTSIEYQSISGSTIFGDTEDDTHEFIGHVMMQSASFGMANHADRTNSNAANSYLFISQSVASKNGYVWQKAGNPGTNTFPFLLIDGANNQKASIRQDGRFSTPIVYLSNDNSGKLGEIDGDAGDSSAMYINANSRALQLSSEGKKTFKINTDGTTEIGGSGAYGVTNFGDLTVGGNLNLTSSAATLEVAGNISGSSSSTGSFGVLKLASYNSGLGGSNNTIFGKGAGVDLTSGDSNTLIGTSAGANITTNSNVVAIGTSAGSTGTTGLNSSVIIGKGALQAGSQSQLSVLIGTQAGYSLSSANTNGTVALGHQSQFRSETGRYNTGLGYATLRTNIDGDSNTAVGYASMYNFEAASDGEGDNTAVGTNALNNATTGTHNTAVGSHVARTGTNDLTTGTGNTLIGSYAALSSGSAVNEIVIGSGSIGLGDNQTVIGNSGQTHVVFGGDALISGSAQSTGSFGKLLGDGSSLTGVSSDVVDDTSPQLGGNLDLNSNDITGTGNINIAGNLTVNGDTTTISTSNILVQDAFGFFATGSAGTNVDAGIIVQSGSFVDSGSALYHDISSERWSVGKGIASTATNVPDSKWGGFVATVYTASASPVGSSPKYGVGEIHVDDDGEIYIYS